MRPSDPAILHQQFEIQAHSTPGTIALHDRRGSITYAELEQRTERLASVLRAQCTDGALIGLHVERSIEYVIGVLGILKANGAVLPLPPSFPEARLKEILSFAELSAVVTGTGIPGASIPQVDSRAIEHTSAERTQRPPCRPDSPAYVLSSSGSTGHPKLIVRSHQSFFHRLRWTWREHPYAADEVCVQKSYATTTHGIYELFEPLLRGVPVHILPDDEVRRLDGFWEFVRRHRVSRLLIVPSMLQASLDATSVEAPHLKVVVLMGEHVPIRLAARALETFPPPARIFSIYGSTEASSTLVCDLRSDFVPDQELPLGKPIDGDIQVAVLDDALVPVPPGGTGMLYISGPALFTGYYKDPGLTASVMLTRNGDGFYRTQDEVRVRVDGALQYVGRSDDTVKVSGFRVDLREVERVLAGHVSVNQCVVLPTQASSGGSSLVAFVTLVGGDVSDLLEHARSRLPSYMVPAAIVPRDAFPLTSHGKIDRRRLLAEYVADADLSGFGSETERRVAEVWSGILGHRQFTRTSSFLEVGGTSLSVFAAAHRLRTAFSLRRETLSDLSIYEHPLLNELAAHIDEIRAGTVATPARPDSVLVTLKRGRDRTLPPLFLISSAGGTLGAYSKLVQALSDDRDIVGVRDPFLAGDRDPIRGFSSWVGRYLDSILERQNSGAYHIIAYSSAGAFGFEIARRLRDMGRTVAVLALIDPLALDRATKARFGYWTLDARFRRRPFTWAMRAVGTLRRVLPRSMFDSVSVNMNDWSLSSDDLAELVSRTRDNRGFLMALSALLELNTGLPFRLTPAELERAGRGEVLRVFLDKVGRVAPDTDLGMMEKLVVQYELQVRAQHNYRLRRYPGTVHLFEPESPHAGLEAAQLRPYADRLHAMTLPIGSASGQAVLNGVFPRSMLPHYLCMRDDVFVSHLAQSLEPVIRNASAPVP